MKNWIAQHIEANRLDPDFAVERLIFEFMGAIHERMATIEMTQAELAQKMGISQARVSRALSYEGNATVKTLARIACALGCEWRSIHLESIAQPKATEECSVTFKITNPNQALSAQAASSKNIVKKANDEYSESAAA